MINENANDKVKLSVYTATNGVWRLITSRAVALQAIQDWEEVEMGVVAPRMTVSGRLNEADQNKVQLKFLKSIITAIEIIEMNQEF